MSDKIYKKLFAVLGLVAGLAVFSSETVAADAVAPGVFKDTKLLAPRTTKTAELFSLEAASRCFVRFNEQDIITTVPFRQSAFKLSGARASDALPRYEVTGFSFAGLSADKVFLKLVKEAGIKVVAEKGPYPVLSGKNMKGELGTVLNNIANTSGVYYRYNAETKTLRLMRHNQWKLQVPDSRPVMIAVLDALRGAGIRDVVADWDNKTITFLGTKEVQQKVEKLIKVFDTEPNIVAFDVRVFRITPYAGTSTIDWQKLVDKYGTNSIRSSVKGVIGRMIITENNEISTRRFLNFVGQHASVVPVSEGVFMVPDNWRSRFDVGRCGKIENPESQLSVLAQATVEGTDKIVGSLVIDSTKGEITNFPSFASEIGDNFLIIGIPSDILGPQYANSEIAMVLSPKIVRIIKEGNSQ
ncbi:MAG: hypothetical protein IKD08_03100 [Alphaproteobacteria bacterium]|nr:hypothetical protein [Alphaproteobacteria bacterium]